MYFFLDYWPHAISRRGRVPLSLSNSLRLANPVRQTRKQGVVAS